MDKAFALLEKMDRLNAVCWAELKQALLDGGGRFQEPRDPGPGARVKEPCHERHEREENMGAAGQLASKAHVLVHVLEVHAMSRGGSNPDPDRWPRPAGQR